MFDFKKTMKQQINQKFKPLAKQYEVNIGKPTTFVRECNGLVESISFYFIRDATLGVGCALLPLYAPINGVNNGIPLQVYESVFIKQVLSNLPVAFKSNEEMINEQDPVLAEMRMKRAIEAFDHILIHLEEILKVFHKIDTLEKYWEQVKKNLLEKPVPEHNKSAMVNYDYVSGVYDCLNKEYVIGTEKLKGISIRYIGI